MKISKTVKISGHEADVNTIITMLRHMEYIGEIGASRNILVRVDGDGSGRIHVYNESGPPMNSTHTKYNIEQNMEGPLVGIYDIG